MTMPEPPEWTSYGPAPLRVRFAVSGAVYADSDVPKGKRRPEEWDPAEHTAPEIQQPIVLIAEDEETIAETLAMIVEDAGYVPIVAYDGREALALARQHRPQLIITDLMMPYMSGSDLIAAVRRDAGDRGSTPPRVVVVTAASRTLGEQSGADVVITKPFDVASIEEAMLTLLGDVSH